MNEGIFVLYWRFFRALYVHLRHVRDSLNE